MLLIEGNQSVKLLHQFKEMAVMQILNVVDQLECPQPHLPPGIVREIFSESSKPCYHGKNRRLAE